MDLEQACPRCKTTKYRNPQLKLMVNVCGHALCESCVDLLFLKGSGSCTECNVPLRRSNFRVQLFEDPRIEKEVDIRKRVLRDYNKKPEDFSTQREYDDYLEEIETIIYNLTNNIDVVATNKRIEQYKRENKEQISKNKGKLGREEYELEELIELERQQDEQRRQQALQEELDVKRKKQRDKEALIDQLIHSDVNASQIVQHFASKTDEINDKLQTNNMITAPPATQFSTGIKIGQSHQVFNSYFMPIPVNVDEGPKYQYQSPYFEMNGPQPPCDDEDSDQVLHKQGYIQHIRAETVAERAGGFVSTLACKRALYDAFAGLYHVSQPMTSSH